MAWKGFNGDDDCDNTIFLKPRGSQVSKNSRLTMRFKNLYAYYFDFLYFLTVFMKDCLQELELESEQNLREAHECPNSGSSSNSLKDDVAKNRIVSRSLWS